MPSWQSRVIKAAMVPLLRRRRRRDGMPTEADLPRIRDEFERLATFARLHPDTVLEHVHAGGVAAERLRTPRDTGERVVLYLHGGAYIMCSPRTHRGLTSSVAHVAHASVLVPDYRLAPEHPYPAGLEDCLEAYRFLLAEGWSPGRIAVAGESAGGGLAIALLVALRDAGDPLPACAALMSPWVDLTGSGESMWERNEVDPWLDAELLHLPAEAYAGDRPLDDPGISPLFADLTGLPPLLVQVGTHEIIHDDACRLVERARAVGVAADLGIFEGLWHAFQAFPIPERRGALRELGGFIRRHTGLEQRWVA